jgi:hypothetical protein
VGTDGGIYTYDGSSWSTNDKVDELNGISGGGLAAVSCTSSSFCMAVDQDDNRSVTFNGSSWSAPTMLSSGYGLASVSCPSRSFCIAVDGNADAFTWHS